MNPASHFTATTIGGVRHTPGIRYAEPPVGPLRFSPPRPASGDPLAGPRGVAGPIAPQSPSRLSNVMGEFSCDQSEDCLNLKVWAPATGAGSRPVLFWIHGGAFMSGAGALDWYAGSTLCREGDVVVVSPNYRLGALGFLSHPGLSKGNLGLLDLELALRWTRDNIHRFGGDPERITVMGQSAGAWSAAMMVARMSSDAPPIRQLILQSGPLGIVPANPDTASAMARHFLQALAGPGSTDAAMDRARQADVSAILAAQGAAIRAVGLSLTAPGHPPVPFGPVCDGIEIPLEADYPFWLDRAAARVPVMVGWTRDEMNAFQPAVAGTPAALQNAHAARQIFGAPSLRWADLARQAGRPAYVFRFDWAPAGSLFGACHCIELPFVFGTGSAFGNAPMLGGESASTVEALSRRVRASWLAFARHGDPNAGADAGLPAWPSYQPDTASVMHIDTLSRVAEATRALD